MRNLILIAGFCLIYFSTFSQVKTNFTKQNYAKFFIEDCIPNDLTTEGLVLLVQSPFEEKATEKNNEITEIFKTYYKLPFIVVPLGLKDYKKTYENTQVYKYSIKIQKELVTYGDPNDKMDIKHIHYELSIIDRLKLSKNTIPEMPEGLSKKEKEKFYAEFRKNIDNYKVDLTAISRTGLEDNHSKLNDMLTFFVKKLVNYKE